jgi:hypothetical protein
MDRRGELLDAKGNKHTEHDDPDLSGELAPAMQRLWKMDAHAG